MESEVGSYSMSSFSEEAVVTEKHSKVIWAIDAFAIDKKLQLATLQALNMLTEKTGKSIEPVAVLSPDQLRIPVVAFAGKAEDIHLEAEAVLCKWLKTIKNKRVLTPKLLVQDSYSVRSSTKALLKYAKETGAEAIGVGTHSKKAWERFFLGSFAESLLLFAEIPTLVVNPKTKLTNFSKILFPTDFSDASLTAFRSLLPIAKARKAKVVLFYKVEYVLPQTVEAIYSAPVYVEHLRSDREAKEQKAKQWQEVAVREGVKLELLFDKRAIYVADSILKAAKKVKAGLIAMASHTGTVSAAFLGSVTRQVIRVSPTPVWVIHPTSETIRKTTPISLLSAFS